MSLFKLYYRSNFQGCLYIVLLAQLWWDLSCSLSWLYLNNTPGVGATTPTGSQPLFIFTHQAPLSVILKNSGSQYTRENLGDIYTTAFTGKQSAETRTILNNDSENSVGIMANRLLTMNVIGPILGERNIPLPRWSEH